MIDYKAVPSGLELSRRIADCLEADAPQAYASSERPQVIRKLNGILQGRSERTVADLLAELEKCGDARLPAVLEDIPFTPETTEEDSTEPSAEQTLARLIKDPGLRDCVWYAADIHSEDTEETIR